MDAKAEFDELFEVLADNDITLELNLRRPLQGDVLESLRSILKGYRSSGGRFVTLGSDAHNTEQIGTNFREGLSLLKETDLAPCTYQERTRVLHPGW
jgi:histidinol-phosphatase (PHP family)